MTLYIFWYELIFWEGNVIYNIHITCITPTDATVENSTNQDWVMLGLRCWSVYDIDSSCNGVHWNFVIIVDSGLPIWSIAWELWPFILGNKIITYLSEYKYGSCWMFLSNNPITEPLYHDGGLVNILSISTYTVNIQKYLCRILPVLSNEVNR